MIEYWVKQKMLADEIEDSSKDKFIFFRLSVGYGNTNSRMSAVQLDRNRQLGENSAYMKNTNQKFCLNSFIFISLCNIKLLLSATETENLFLLFLARQLHSLYATIVIRSPFIRVTPGEDKPCTSLT